MGGGSHERSVARCALHANGPQSFVGIFVLIQRSRVCSQSSYE
jgi:hypothetical protein